MSRILAVLIILVTAPPQPVICAPIDPENAASEVIDGLYLRRSTGELRHNYFLLFKEYDGEHRDNVGTAARILGDHFYQQGNRELAAEYYMIALKLGPDLALERFLEAKNILPPYSKEKIRRELPR